MIKGYYSLCLDVVKGRYDVIGSFETEEEASNKAGSISSVLTSSAEEASLLFRRNFPFIKIGVLGSKTYKRGVAYVWYTRDVVQAI